MKILVVEDDQLLNTTLCYNLSAAGYEVDLSLIHIYTYAQIGRMIYGETDIGEEMYSSAYCLIGSLRKKLEKDPRHPRYLHTVYGVGYRFEIA